MPKLTSATPKYRKHRASGQAVVSIAGRDHYLGPWKSKTSIAEYDRLIAEWLANGRYQPARAPNALTVSEVLVRYWRFAKGHYRGRDGKQTASLHGLRQALRPLRRLYGHTPSGEFGPLALKALRQSMVKDGLCRGTVNKRVDAIKRVFRWAVEEELVSPSVHQALLAVRGLQKGRTTAPEPEAVRPVPEADVQATLPHLPAIVADMALLQHLTGCRPGEVVIVRPCDIDRTGEVWAYRPESHKAEHHGRERVIHIGPKAQLVLQPYLLREAETYCFSPAESEKARLDDQHGRRKTPLSCGNRPGSNRRRRPKRKAGDRYTRDSYRRAIHRACDTGNVDKWSPNRLRHSAATEIRKRYGLEAAQVTLGHATADVSQIYAERDLSLAMEIMRKIG